jgi:hypothetical protein
MSRQERDTTVNTFTKNEPEMITRTTEAERREKVEGPVTWEEMRALLRREPMVYERTWKPTTGGLLAIVAGSWNFLLGLGAALGSTVFSNMVPTISGISGGFGTVGIPAGVVMIVLGMVSIIGGAYALTRRRWGMVLAGSITALIPTPIILPFIMGFFALIFNVLGRREFR